MSSYLKKSLGSKAHGGKVEGSSSGGGPLYFFSELGVSVSEAEEKSLVENLKGRALQDIGLVEDRNAWT